MARGAARPCALVACAAGVIADFLAFGVAGAQTNRSVAQVERDRRAESVRAERLGQEAAAARREVRTLDARLIESAQRRAEAGAAATAAEQRLAELQNQIQVETVRRLRAREALVERTRPNWGALWP